MNKNAYPSNDILLGTNYNNEYINSSEIIKGTAYIDENTGEIESVVYDTCLDECSDVILYLDFKYNLIEEMELNLNVNEEVYDLSDSTIINIEGTVYFYYKNIDEKFINSNSKYLVITSTNDIIFVDGENCYSMGQGEEKNIIDNIEFSYFLGKKETVLEKKKYDIFRIIQ